jgi:hypothetical protein
MLVGCGGAPATHSGDPAQTVRQAAAQLQGQSFRMAMTSSTTIDSSQVTGPAGQSFAQGAGQAGNVTLHTDVQDATHLSEVASVTGHQFHLVVFGSSVYVSADGTSYQVAPFLSSFVAQFSSSQVTDYAQHLSNTRDVGPSTQDGIATEEYVATVDPGYLSTLTQKLIGTMSGAFGSTGIPTQALDALSSAMHFQDLTLDWYLSSSTGQLVRQVTQGSIQMDLGKIFAALGPAASSGGGASGTATIKESADAHFSGWGTHITIPEPVSTGTLTPQGFGQLLLQAPPATS